MAMSAEHTTKYAALHQQWWSLHMIEKILKWDEKPETNIQNKTILQRNMMFLGLKKQYNNLR